MMENGEGGKFTYDIFDIFCECNNIPPPSMTTREILAKRYKTAV
jgi:hypothetical protein